MYEVPPCTVSSVTSFEPYPLRVPHGGRHHVFGHGSRDGTWAWIARGSMLEVFSLNAKERCAVFCFGNKEKGQMTITAIKELFSSHINFPCLLVGLDTLTEGGLLCVYNVKTSKVINAIQLPYKITSLEVVSSAGGVSVENCTLSSQLRFFFGIVSVGTETGHILLVDLCLDTENYSNENVPNKGILLNKLAHNISSKREFAIANNHHLCVLLNDNSFNNDIFEYEKDHTLLKSYMSDDAIITAMKYIRSLAGLVVGFNFGGIQLWNLKQLSLMLSVPVPSDHQPVVHFAFQEPENDPRSHCYLWAIRGHYQGENYRPCKPCVARLYCLSFTKKEWIPRYGYLYQELQRCTMQFEYTFSDDIYSSSYVNSPCSRLITCNVIPHIDVLGRIGSEDCLQSEEWNSAEDMNLCAMAWENWPEAEEKPTSSYLVLFDLNQWYQAQMPSSLRYCSGNMCSFLGVFSLKEAARRLDNESIAVISVVPDTLGRFKSTSVTDEMFYPSSLSFKVWCMTAEGILQASYLGAQKQLLSRMNSVGPNILIEPRELYKQCLANGLLQQMNEVAPSKQISVPKQRETLLTLALESNMIQFLVSCVHKWKNIESMHAGCSSKFMLEWLWKTVTRIKTSIDKFCQPLFNCCGQGLDETVLLNLHNYKTRLKHLSDIIMAFQNSAGPHTEQGRRELQLRKEVVDSIFIYLHVVIWLYDCKLLPEHAEGDEYGEDEVAYPFSILSKTYSYRRNELHRLQNSLKENDILLVDGIVCEFGDPLASMWESKGGCRAYPPPSIYAAVSSYLIDDVSLSKKHMLMYYLLLDLSAYLSDRQSHLLEKLMMFCSTNNISTGLSKLTQAFWHLDHQDFETAMTILADPMISDFDITPDYHARVLKSLLFQDQVQKASKYINIRSPPETTDDEIKLHLSVLLSNGLIADAFDYQRRHQNEDNIDDLFAHMFLGCQQTHLLDAFLQLPFNSLESAALSKYLHSCVDPRAPELLVLFHLLRCRPLEAATLNEKLAPRVMERSSKSLERAAARNALVAGFLDTLPEEQKRLAQELNQIYLRVDKRAVNPLPLSATITSSSLTCISYSDLLSAVMEKLAHSNCQESMEAHTPFRSSKSTISTTPFLRSPFAPQSKKRKRFSVIPSPGSRKSTPAGPESNEMFTPVKKSRMFDIASFRLTDADQRYSVRSKMQQKNELLALLQTPPISRKPSRARTSRVSETATEITPLSILKTKASSQKPFVAIDEDSYPKTPSVCSEVSKDEEMPEHDVAPVQKSLETSRLRQLRFHVPSPEHKISKASPRRPLRVENKVISQLDLGITSEERPLAAVLEAISVAEARQSPVPSVPSAVDAETPSHHFENEEFTLHISNSESSSQNTTSSNSRDFTELEVNHRTDASTGGFDVMTQTDAVKTVEVIELNSSSSGTSDTASEGQSQGDDASERVEDYIEVCDTSDSETSRSEPEQIFMTPEEEPVLRRISDSSRDRLVRMSLEEVKNCSEGSSVPSIDHTTDSNHDFMLRSSQEVFILPDTEEKFTERSQSPALPSRSSSRSRTSENNSMDLPPRLMPMTFLSSDIGNVVDPCCSTSTCQSSDAPVITLGENEDCDIAVSFVGRSRSRSKSKSPSRVVRKKSTERQTIIHVSLLEEKSEEAEQLYVELLPRLHPANSDEAEMATTESDELEKLVVADSFVCTRSRSRSKSASPSRVVQKSTKLLSVAHMQISPVHETAEESEQSEVNLSPKVHPAIYDETEMRLPENQKSEDSDAADPFIGTRSRSRSKSMSPSRVSRRKSTKKLSVVHVEVSPVQEICEEHEREDVDLFPRLVPTISEEVEMMAPEDIEMKPAISSSPYLGTRSRSRSKSVSPSRTISKKAQKNLPKLSPVKSDVSKHGKIVEQDSKKITLIEETENLQSDEAVGSCQSSVKTQPTEANLLPAVEKSTFSTAPSSSATIERQRLKKNVTEASMSVQKSDLQNIADKTPAIEAAKSSGSSKDLKKSSSRVPKTKDDSKKKDEAFGVREKAIRKKNIGKASKKVEFTFSEPHSSADASILQALCTSPSTPVPPFVFSPPATRTRARLKKLDDTLDTVSTPTTAHETSVVKFQKEDPLVQDEGLYVFTGSSSSQQEDDAKEKPTEKSPEEEASYSENLIRFISPFDKNESSQKGSRQLPSAKHSMVLRKTRKKKKSVKLF